MNEKQNNAGWNWNTAEIPKSRRISLTRRCYLDLLFRRTQKAGRLSQTDMAVLDFLFGLSSGHVHTLQETSERFGLTDAQVRHIKMTGLSGDSREWAKMLLAEAYEGEGGLNFVRSWGEWPKPGKRT